MDLDDFPWVCTYLCTYLSIYHLSINHMNMVPLVFEHYGTWGEKAQNCLKEISKRWVDEDGRANNLEFLTYWRRRFSVTLQKSIARVILRKLDTLTVACEEIAKECRDIQLYLH